jgi:lipopolysaccharide transport system ATP-binding protein
MAFVELCNVTLDYPVISPEALNLKRLLVDRVLGRSNQPAVIRAIDDISARFEPGTKVGLFGPNGAGKSSLLRLIGRIYQPTSGKVLRVGRCTSLLGLGLGANIELSAKDNIALLLRFEGIEPDEEIIRDIWEFTEIDERFFNLSLRHFSTGMMMRLFFAVSTAAEPEILLMDEWLSVVDENFMFKAEKRLREYINKASVVVLSSHNPSLLRDVCDQVLFLERGRICGIEEKISAGQRWVRQDSAG